MRGILTAFAVALLMVSTAITEQAWAEGGVDNTRRSMGNLRSEAPGGGWTAQRGVDNTRRSMGNLRPEAPSAGRVARGPSQAASVGSRVIVVPQPYYLGYPYSPYYGGYSPYYPGGYGYYGYYPGPYGYSTGPWYAPPVVVPPGTLFGPQAMRRFMGAPW